MKTITISTETSETYSSISNFFIDYYMTDANGEFVKVYLYLIRLLSNNTAFTVAEIADHFNLTENDICRAIKYWVARDVLKLNYDGKGYPTGIVLLPLSRPTHGLEASSDALSILRKPLETEMITSSTTSANVTPGNASANAGATPRRRRTDRVDAANSVDANVYNGSQSGVDANSYNGSQSGAGANSYNGSQSKVEASTPQKRELAGTVVDELIRNEEWSDLQDTIEAIIIKSGGNPFTMAEINSLYYMHYDLGYDLDTIAYLVYYSSSKDKIRGKNTLAYVETIARNLYDDGARTKKDVEKQCGVAQDIIKDLHEVYGMTNANFKPFEFELVNTWHMNMGFSEEMIHEACVRAVKKDPASKNYDYLNGILNNWNAEGVKTLEDLKKKDDAHAIETAKANEERKSGKKSTSKVSDFNSFAQTKMDNEMAQLEELILVDVNRKRG